MGIEVEVMCKEMVKPSSPTPDHLHRHKLSLIDQTSFPVFMPWVFTYPKTSNATNEERCNVVKKSLSEALTLFYPLAGRIRGNDYVECNDVGVPFLQAQAECTIADIFRDPIPSEMNKLLPREIDYANDLPLVVQVTFFDCGGMSIGSGIFHKVGDAFSQFLFLNCWAAVARGDKNSIIVPCFDSAAAFFPPKFFPGPQPTAGIIIKEKVVAKRFVFDASTIAALRSKYAEKCRKENMRLPTRIEALSTFILSRFKEAVTEAEAEAEANSVKTYAASYTVNLRSKMDPPLSDPYFGNFYAAIVVFPDMAHEDWCHQFISHIKGAMKNINADHVKALQGGDTHLDFVKEMMDRFASTQVVSFKFTSLCRFPVREADFGWGKPIWAGSAGLAMKNLVTFIDTKEGDGIEAWINLKEEDMVKFEADNEIVAHVSPASKIM